MQWIYRAAMQRRRANAMARRELETAPCPIVSVGNLTTGGTGKTPAVQWLAQSLQNRGWKVGIAARGYGGSASEKGLLVSDGRPPFKSALEAGDEAVLHARLPGTIVAVAKNRHRAVEICVQNGAQIVVLDDGFQFWSLPRAFDLVLLDARRPLGNGHLLPRGRLREEPAALKRASAILLTRCDLASEAEIEKTRLEIGKWTFAPIFRSHHAPRDLRDERSGEIIDLGFFKRRALKACAGLADNEQFYASVNRLGAAEIVRLKREFGDHHVWRARDFAWQGAPPLNAHQNQVFERLPVVTTEKDAVKLDPNWFAGPLFSLRIRLEIEAEWELAAPDFEQTTRAMKPQKLTRATLKSHQIRVIHAGKGLQSSVYLVDWNGQRVAVKDFSRGPKWFRWLVAPFLVKREVRALRYLNGTPGIPRFCGQIDRYAFAIEFIEGRPLSGIHKGELTPEKFADLFARMAIAVAAMHARGVAHGDLKRRSNLLLAPDGEVFIIDFAAAIIARGPISRAVMRAVAEVDEKSLPRLKRFVAPEQMTTEDTWKLDNPTKLEKWVEEVVGAIDLPRPAGGGWIYLGLSMAAFFGVQLSIRGWVEALLQPRHWSREVTDKVTTDIGIIVCVAAAIVIFLWRNHSNPVFQIRKGRNKISVSSSSDAGSKRLEFWTGETTTERVMPVFGFVFLCLITAKVVLTNPRPIPLSATIGFMASTLITLWLLPTIWRPILVVDEKGATIGKRFFNWAAVERVEVEHVLNLDGAFYAVQFAFFDAKQKRLARVRLPKDKCKMDGEEELIEFVAARLGRRYEHLAHPDPNWL